MPQIWIDRTRSDLEAEAIAGATTLAGSCVTADDVRRVLAGDRPFNVSFETADQVDAYAATIRFAAAQSGAARLWEPSLILAIHKKVMPGLSATGDEAWRRSNRASLSQSAERPAYVRAPARSVPALVGEVMEWLGGSESPAPIASAFAHVALAGIRPFGDGNGRTARILASLVMQRGGYDSPLFASLDAWWARHVESYHRSFACLGSAWDASSDVTPFIEAHLKAQVSHVEALVKRLNTERRLWAILHETAVEDLSLNERATHALYDAFFARDITGRYYRGVTGASEAAASADVAKLVSAGMLQIRGAGRNARYVAAPGLYECVLHSADLSPRLLPPSGSLGKRRDAVLAGLVHGASAERDIRD